MLKLVISHPLFYPFILFLYILLIYHKFFIWGKIPFPGDLLVTSYSPWFDYYKFPVQNPLISDIFSQFFLWKYLMIDSFRNFQWPLWNPYSFMGTPLLATYHSAVLYPLNLLLLAPRYFGWGLFISSQTFVAAFGMYLLLSLWLENKVARLVGSIIFSLGGLMTTWLEFGTAVHAMSWIPLSLFSLERFLITKKMRYLLMIITSSTFILLAGNVQVATYAFLIICSYLVVQLWGNPIKIITPKLLLVFAAVIFSLGLSAPQLLPSADLLRNSIRTSDSYIQNYNYGLLPLNEFYKFFIPDYYGNPVTRNYWGFLNYSETSSFVGSITLILIIYSIFFLKKNRNIYFFIALLGGSLALSFSNPLSGLIYRTQIPILTLSYASRMLFLATFSIAVLSAYSLNQIANSNISDRKILKSLLWSTAAIIGIMLGTFITQYWIKSTIPSSPSDFYTETAEYSPLNYSVALKNSLIPFLLLFVSMIFYALLRFLSTKYPNFINKSSLLIFSVFLTLLLSLDLGRYFLKFNPFTDQNLVYPPTPTLKFLQEQPGIFRVGREHAEVFPPNTWTAYKIQSIEGYDPLYLKNYSKFMHFLNGGDIRNAATGRYAELSAKYYGPYIDITNTKYFVGITRDKDGYIGGDFIHYSFLRAEYPVIFKDRNSVVMSNPNALERVYFSSSFIIKSPEEIEKIIMTDPSFDPRKTTAISEDLGLVDISGQGEAKIIEYSPNKVAIQTQTQNDELLVLTDQFDKGWRAEIDGVPTKIAQANVILRAVKVPAGRHEVIFYYFPDSFSSGLKLFVVTLLALILSIVILRKKI